MMTTLDNNCVNCNKPNFGVIFFFMFLCFVGIGIVMILTGGDSISHAAIKHGVDAMSTNLCLDKNGADLIYNKTDTRKVQLCFIGLDESGKFKKLGIRVLEKISGKWEEITRFSNDNITNVNDAVGFAENDMGKYGWIDYVKDSWKMMIAQ
jgi:hypothetical protein